MQGTGIAISGNTISVAASTYDAYGAAATAQSNAETYSSNAANITSGQLALAQGGTGANLSSTGGAHQVLKQSTSGGTVTVGQLGFTDLSSSIANAQLQTQTVIGNQSATGDANGTLVICTDATGHKTLVLQSIAGQTGHLVEYQDSNGITTAYVDAIGNEVCYGQNITLNGLLQSTMSAGTPTSGGSFSAGTYYWCVAPTNGNGEGWPSNAVSKTVTANQEVPLSWTQITGATGYRVYRNTSINFTSGSILVAVITNGSTLSTTDTGSSVTGATPNSNPAGICLTVQGAVQQGTAFQVLQSNGTQNIAFSSASSGVIATFYGAAQFAASAFLASGGSLAIIGGCQMTLSAVSGVAAYTFIANTTTQAVTSFKGTSGSTQNAAQVTDSNLCLLGSWNCDGSFTTNGVAVNTFGNLAVPSGITAGSPASGGSFAAGTYYWVVTATNAAGETIQSSQVSATLSASQKIAISWTQVPGATGYKVYRSTTSGTYGSSSLLTSITNGTTVSYTDTGSATATGTPPTAPTGSKIVNKAWAGQGGHQEEWQSSAGTVGAFVDKSQNINTPHLVGAGTSPAIAAGAVLVRARPSASVPIRPIQVARSRSLPDQAQRLQPQLPRSRSTRRLLAPRL